MRPLLLHLGAAGLPELEPVADVRGSWAPAVYTPPVLPGPQLAIDAGVVTVNCKYSDFRLVLDANVTSFAFINADEADVVRIEVEQTGAFTVALGAACTPIDGSPYVVSGSPGLVDVLTLSTFDGGGTWRYSVQQPDPAALAVTLAPSPANGTVDNDGSGPVAPSVQVTATPTGGTAPYTQAWTRADSGGTAFLVDDATAAAPTFSIAAGTSLYEATQRWRCTVTDANGLVAQNTVDITLQRTVSCDCAASVAITDHTVESASGDFNIASSRIVVGTDGALSWQREQDFVITSGDYPGEWLTEGLSSDVEVKAELLSGAAPDVSGSAPLNAWLACSTDRMWGRASTSRTATTQLLLSFRDAATLELQGSAVITLTTHSYRGGIL